MPNVRKLEASGHPCDSQPDQSTYAYAVIPLSPMVVAWQPGLLARRGGLY